ncbi:sensor histidine kinase [Gorillibacterium sp. sgz5001074]|uniref:sensor histidine kinase n=1 Tax=Gorillibacterium sp. sgz5001074 TaxID=3446695 RepID=UPI003F66B40E
MAAIWIVGLVLAGAAAGFGLLLYVQARKLKSGQDRLAAVFEHIQDGMLILDADLNILESNPAAKRMMGRRAESGRFHFCTVCTDESGMGKRCDYDACFLLPSDGQSREIAIRTPEGGMRSVSLTVSSYQEPDGGLRYIFRLGELDRERRDERERISKMMTHSILLAQERERKRLSRELHDGIGQSLYGALIQLDVLTSSLEEGEEHPAYGRIEKLQTSLRQTIEDIRHLSAELRPSVLDDMGLLAALRHHIQSFGEKFGIQVNFTYEGDKRRLPAAYETALYRIAQEALTNAAKYAQTGRIDVALKQGNGEAVLTVRDYGVGFALPSLTEKRGVGLYSMEERAEALNGVFRLESEPGAGTVATVVLPLPEGGEEA